ncbi:hypothetical protein D8I30_11385 [Brevundimonas naejangsanensis]|uniref:Uncharacterized protein n=1 Tax=Brevundimonas naejangsanensis TaxID=588932 RepID=A0A494RH09_9CAUL|nr:hypothetical protein [Brevundimonas naejangsanensis]AYG95715.1 hypothetical protein D8I30_11385 [Brevundimonas naejangsanensis]
MLAALLVAGQVAAQEPPRFTMTPEAGDALTAELFRLEPSNVDAQVASLLDGGRDQQSGEVVAVRSPDGLNMAYREGTLPYGPIVLYAGSEVEWQPDSICRMTRDPEGVVDNSERAARWCLSFVMRWAPTVVIPPAPVH